MVAPVSDQQQSAAGHAACWALVEGRPGAGDTLQVVVAGTFLSSASGAAPLTLQDEGAEPPPRTRVAEWPPVTQSVTV